MLTHVMTALLLVVCPLSPVLESSARDIPPHLWCLHHVAYPGGNPVPGANLSFRAWLVKPSGVPVPGYLTEDDTGCGVLDVDPQVYVECSWFGDLSLPDTWWAPGDTICVMVLASDDPETGETDSVLVRDILDSSGPVQYYDEQVVVVPVELIAFTAARTPEGIMLSWTVARELDNLGFYIQRSAHTSGPYVRISDLIPGRGTAAQEATYSWIDHVAPGRCAAYVLEDVDFQGQSTLHGPIRAIVGGAASWGAIKAAFTE